MKTIHSLIARRRKPLPRVHAGQGSFEERQNLDFADSSGPLAVAALNALRYSYPRITYVTSGGPRPMKTWKTVDRARAPGGGELLLQERDGQFAVRVDGKELMSSRMHGSEEAMPKLALQRLPRSARPRVLVGGLGLGFTLAATLKLLPPGAVVVVAELSPAVVNWNRGPVAHLAGSPLEDPRVSVEERDVLEVSRKASQPFDAILLDVDNGPVALTVKANSALYGPKGTAALRDALTPGGVLVVWSAGPDEAYLKTLQRGGFSTELKHYSEHGKRHTLFVAKRDERRPRPSSD